MQCAFCARTPRRGLVCPPCAQTTVWPLRTSILFATSERDAAAEKVQEHLDRTSLPPSDQLRERISTTRAESARVAQQLQERKLHLAALRTATASRRAVLDTALDTVPDRSAVLAATQAKIKRLNASWKQLYTRTAEARSFICREAASLVGLRLKRRRSGRVEFWIAGIPLPNLLTDLTTHPYTQLTVSLDHLAHLLVLIAHYLGLRLPHEIILSSRDNAVTSIRGNIGSRHMTTRALTLEGPLASLTPGVQSRFVEGVAMLAVDVAWVCFSQGMEVMEVEEAADVGRCLWKLLVAKDSTAATNPAFGRTSHATVNGNLATAPGEALMAGFRLRWNMVADKIRGVLQGETMGADWEVVAGEEEEGVGRWTRIRARGDGV